VRRVPHAAVKSKDGSAAIAARRERAAAINSLHLKPLRARDVDRRIRAPRARREHSCRMPSRNAAKNVGDRAPRRDVQAVTPDRRPSPHRGRARDEQMSRIEEESAIVVGLPIASHGGTARPKTNARLARNRRDVKREGAPTSVRSQRRRS
jgi:hypothetical protein